MFRAIRERADAPSPPPSSLFNPPLSLVSSLPLFPSKTSTPCHCPSFFIYEPRTFHSFSASASAPASPLASDCVLNTGSCLAPSSSQRPFKRAFTAFLFMTHHPLSSRTASYPLVPRPSSCSITQVPCHVSLAPPQLSRGHSHKGRAAPRSLHHLRSSASRRRRPMLLEEHGWIRTRFGIVRAPYVSFVSPSLPPPLTFPLHAPSLPPSFDVPMIPYA